MSFDSIRKIKLEEMMEYIDKNEPSWRGEFVKFAYQNKDGETVEKYNHLNATRQFCKHFMPHLLGKSKSKVDTLKEWAKQGTSK